LQFSYIFVATIKRKCFIFARGFRDGIKQKGEAGPLGAIPNPNRGKGKPVSPILQTKSQKVR
jgi:hypothetical protein